MQRGLEVVCGRVYRKISSRSSRFFGQEWPWHLTARSARVVKGYSEGEMRAPVCGPRESIDDRFGVYPFTFGSLRITEDLLIGRPIDRSFFFTEALRRIEGFAIKD